MRKKLAVIVFFAAMHSLFSGEEQLSANEKSESEKTDGVQIATDEKTPEEKSEDEGLKTGLQKGIEEVLDRIADNDPSFFKNESSVNQGKIIEGFVKSLNSGIDYVKPGVKPETLEGENETNADPFPGVTLSVNRFFYLRIDSFSSANFAKAKEDCEAVSRLQNQPKGVIVDLRNCDSYDYEDAMRTLALFMPPESVPFLEDSKKTERILKYPVFVLAGQKTKGAAEVFAYIISKSKDSLVIGENTAGMPFRKKDVELKSGAMLRIPVVPEEFKDIPALSVNPLVAKQAYPQCAYDKLTSQSVIDSEDKILQSAIDLLICLDSIKQ